jgi:hypothetical protein
MNNNVTVERMSHNGHVVVRAMVRQVGWQGSWLESRQYVGYTKAEAEARFRDYCAEEGFVIGTLNY